MTKEIMIDGERVDWKSLREQKEALIWLRTACRGRDNKQWKSWFEALTGILNLLDYIQDQAAEVQGEEAVFGYSASDSWVKE